MTTFDEREKSFEKKFAHDEELRFKATARRIKLLGAFDVASRSLDFGAEGIIAPMINTVADAKAFVSAAKFPPLGERSWGPTRAMTLAGIADAKQYLSEANAETVTLAMIET